MKKIILSNLIFILGVSFASAACVDITDNTTYDGNIVWDGGKAYVYDDIVLCTDLYNYPYASLEPNASNIVMDCNGSTLRGYNAGSGININNQDNITVQNCNFEKFANGIQIYQGHNNMIINNNFTDGQLNNAYSSAIMIHNGTNNTILENEMIANNRWVRILRADDNVVSDNLIEGNLYGIYIEHGSEGNTITGNTVINSDQRGIYIYKNADNTIYNNYFDNEKNAFF